MKQAHVQHCNLRTKVCHRNQGLKFHSHIHQLQQTFVRRKFVDAIIYTSITKSMTYQR